MIHITEKIRKVDKEIPVLINANAGLPILQGNCTFFPESPNMMAAFAPHLVKAGANIIGGCCGTTPDHIHKLVEILH